jgi:hypothetical protein
MIRKPKVKLKIINRAKWPEWFVKPICRWIVRRAGVGKFRRDYTIELASFRRRDCFAGRAYGYKQRTRINRRMHVPHVARYRDYKDAHAFRCETRMEAFVYIVAHEAYHDGAGRPDARRKINPNSDRRDKKWMEFNCEWFARDTVREFRKLWAVKFRPLLFASARKRHQTRASKRRKPIKISDAPAVMELIAATNPKLIKARADLARWQRKLKLATGKVRKYKRRVTYYERREGLPVAARKSSNAS